MHRLTIAAVLLGAAPALAQPLPPPPLHGVRLAHPPVAISPWAPMVRPMPRPNLPPFAMAPVAQPPVGVAPMVVLHSHQRAAIDPAPAPHPNLPPFAMAPVAQPPVGVAPWVQPAPVLLPDNPAPAALPPVALPLAPAPVVAEPPIDVVPVQSRDTSALIRDRGLAGAEAELAALTAPDGGARMGLAAVRFLRGFEAVYQARWGVGATEPGLPLPGLSAPLPPNPAPQPMTADHLNRLFADLGDAMIDARAPLATPFTAADGLVLRLPDLWFDVDGDGRRSFGEGLVEIAMPELGLWELPPGPGEIRFDAADTQWLTAYTHMVEGLSQAVLAFDPAPELARLIDTRAAIGAQWAAAPESADLGMGRMMEAQMGGVVDMLAVAINTLRHHPDPSRVQQAVAHVHDMIAANRSFWLMVEQEHDDDREWIPNGRQQAALGFTLPEGSGATWLDVLAQAEAMLNGDLLIPYWRFAPTHGIDLGKWLSEPQPVDLVGWIQGADALPYAAKGPLMEGDALRRFSDLVGGNAGLYMVLLN